MSNLLSIKIDPNRIYGLDILRALAILFVVIGHGREILPKNFRAIHNYIVFDGVSIFFVLSGFLIGGILIKTFETNKTTVEMLINFWIRRWFRTLPNYFLILLILLWLTHLDYPAYNFAKVKEYFYFSQNLWTSHPPFFPEAWSLSIEEWFYLLIPILLFFLIKVFRLGTKQSILFSAILILISITAFRYYRFSIEDIESAKDWHDLFRRQVITRLDSLMYGIIGAFTMYYYKPLWLKYKNPALIFGIILMVGLKIMSENGVIPFLSLFNCVFSFSITSLGTLLLLPYLSDLKSGKGLVFKSLTYVSLISYSMYLINFSLVLKQLLRRINFEQYFESSSMAIGVEYFSFWFFTIVLSALIYKYFEIPMMNLRDFKIVKRLFKVEQKVEEEN